MSAEAASPSSGRSSSSSSTGGDNSYPASSSASEATHSVSDSSDSESGSSASGHSASSSRSHSRSSSTSATSSSGSSQTRSADGDDDGDTAPRKLPRLEEADQQLHPTHVDTIGRPVFPVAGAASIFPAPPVASLNAYATEPPSALPRYGPVLPPPPALPTLSASAKDLTEMDVRAGLRLGVHWAPTRLNKEQVMDEVESVRMTSSVERVLIEAPSQVGQSGVPVQEKEYEWATVFFADAEAAELCMARFCQPGRRSKWSWLVLQRLPLISHVTVPLSTAEEQRYRVHAYQLESAAAATPGISAVTTAALPDTVLARGSGGWCVVSTGGLFPTLGLANYLRNRRKGVFSSVDVCAAFDADPEHDTCPAGGGCGGLHLREGEQWKLLLPVVRPAKASVGTSPHLAPVSAASGAAAPVAPGETLWQRARHHDTLLVQPLPDDIDESGFVYMFRGCKGFLRGQTLHAVDQVRYGVVQFADAATAEVARAEATANTSLSVAFYGAAGGSHGAPTSTSASSGTTGTASNGHEGMALSSPEENATRASAESGEAGAAHAPRLPFPPLPEGWEYGLSRRTMKYFFLQSGKKSTTWKHPVTQEQYKAKR